MNRNFVAQRKSSVYISAMAATKNSTNDRRGASKGQVGQRKKTREATAHAEHRPALLDPYQYRHVLLTVTHEIPVKFETAVPLMPRRIPFPDDEK